MLDEKPGESNIDDEITSDQNHRFVLHDSRGFEPGDEKYIDTVREFIKVREEMTQIGDKLHAIWQVDLIRGAQCIL